MASFMGGRTLEQHIREQGELIDRRFGSQPLVSGIQLSLRVSILTKLPMRRARVSGFVAVCTL